MKKLCFLTVFLVGHTFFGCKSKSQEKKATPSDQNSGTTDPTPTPTNTDSPSTEVLPGPDPTVTGGKVEGGREFCLAYMTKSVVGDQGVTAQIGNKYYVNLLGNEGSVTVPDSRSQSTINPSYGFTSIAIPFDSFKTNCDPKVIDPPTAYVALDDVPMFLEENFSTKVCAIPKGTYFPWNDITAFNQYPTKVTGTAGYVTIIAAHENMPLACRGKTVYTQRTLVARSHLKF